MHEIAPPFTSRRYRRKRRVSRELQAKRGRKPHPWWWRALRRVFLAGWRKR